MSMVPPADLVSRAKASSRWPEWLAELSRCEGTASLTAEQADDVVTSAVLDSWLDWGESILDKKCPGIVRRLGSLARKLREPCGVCRRPLTVEEVLRGEYDHPACAAKLQAEVEARDKWWREEKARKAEAEAAEAEAQERAEEILRGVRAWREDHEGFVVTSVGEGQVVVDNPGRDEGESRGYSYTTVTVSAAWRYGIGGNVKSWGGNPRVAEILRGVLGCK